jgi:glycosyltransferase involved in cell wall biosynthesis
MSDVHNPAKILVVSGTPPPYSGPEIMTANLLRSALCERYRLIHFNISKGRGVETKAKFDWENIFYGLVQPFQLIYYILRYWPDLIYTNLAQNTGGFLRYASFILCAALFNKPVVVRVMGDGFNHFYQRSSMVLRWLIRQTLTKIDGMIVRATVLKHQFQGLVPEDKLFIVYSGIDASEFDQPRERNPDDEIQILFVGYLTQAKGALDVLKCVPRVIACEPNVRFKFMGQKINVERNITYVNNPLQNEVVLAELLSQPDITPYVELLGERSGQEKVAAFVNADLFVFPSYSEAFPTVVLEAMAAGLPVVATPVGALPEVFDHRQICFVEPGNIPQLSESICLMIRDHAKMRRIGADNKKYIQEHFNLEKHADWMDHVFGEILLRAKR